jgi:hypothetical protein
MSTSDLYVCPLNKAFEGPYAPKEAVRAAVGHVYVHPDQAAQVRDSIAAGDPGPWHFVYGFISVTIQREYPQ